LEDGSSGDAPDGAPQRHYLLVFEGPSCYSFDLPASGPVVVGRAPECELRIDAASASRQHARIDVSGDAVWVCDLTSRNGTRVNGDLISATRQIFSGDVISICTATLFYHLSAQTTQQLTPLPLSYLRQRLQEEICRSRYYQRPVSVLRLRCLSAASQKALGDAVQKKLRTLDILAWS